ncbi:MAG: HNH endonuclease [Planctomycetota bacterium JB042]
MNGFVANTDYGWYRFLRERPHLDEVNFWQPSGKRVFRAIPPGAPLLFKLKKPHYAIAGFGVFARAQVLPDWLAWECFGEGNGASDFLAMRERIQRLRRSNRVGEEKVPNVGCIVLAQPVFFPEDAWVRQPHDWKKNVVTGATYDLTRGEGLRILTECRERASALAGPSVVREASEAYGRGILVHPRLGQGTFRLAVQDAYDASCAVTGEHSLPALEAAHIRPYSLERRHDVRTGLLLRGDLHRLFDRGYVTVTPDGEFLVSGLLREDFKNGHTYYPYDRQSIRLPREAEQRPDRERLAWHAETVFLS